MVAVGRLPRFPHTAVLAGLVAEGRYCVGVFGTSWVGSQGATQGAATFDPLIVGSIPTGGQVLSSGV